MKVSNSKKELARIISENGGWRERAEWAAQDKSYCSRKNNVVLYKSKPPKPQVGESCWGGLPGEMLVEFEAGELVRNWHQTILSREEYFHLNPTPDADGWIEWKGGECPVDGDVNVKFWSGTIKENPISAHELYWKHDGDISDIIAYRPHNPEKAKPEFCESVMRSIPEPEAKPTIEQLASDYRNAKDYAERKQQEADDAKADAEAKLADLIAAGKALGLVLSVEREEGAVTPIHPPLIADDWRSWRQWEVGDFVSWSILGHIGDFKIIAVHHDASRSIGDFEIEDSFGGVYRAYGNECKFIRRP